MSDSDQIYKCLYSGTQLTESTTAEHVIPKGLGGKIASNRLISSKVNNKLSPFDNAIIHRYYYVLHMLSPFMATKARPGQMNIELPGIKNGKFVMINGSIYPSRDIQHVIIDNKKHILTHSEIRLPPYLKAKATNSQVILYSDQKDEFGDNTSINESLVSPLIDIALLKIATQSLAYYAMISNRNELTNNAQKTGRLLFKSLNNENQESDIILKHSFGFQFERTDYYISLIKKTFGYIDILNHYVVGFTNPTTKTLDIAVVLFGCEVFGVRISRDCTFPLGFILRNGIDKNDYHDCVEFLPDDGTEILYTERKSVLQREIKDPEGHFYLQIQSMNRLVTESEFFAETKSFERFKSAVGIARDYWQMDNENADYHNLGEYMSTHIKKYFSRSIPEFTTQPIEDFSSFHQIRFDKDEIPEDILERAFRCFTQRIIDLEIVHGKPKNLIYRGFECDQKKNIKNKL